MEVLEKLQEIGLTGNESKVYLELVKKAELSANQVAKNLGMDRTLTYTVLNHLIEKGQVSYVIKNNKKVFSILTPASLLNSIKAKELLALDLIQELNKINVEKNQETEINVYEGKEGVRAFVNLGLKEKEFCSFGSTGRAYFELYEMPAVVKKVQKSNTKIRVIGDKKYKGTEAFVFKKMQFRFLDVKSEVTTSVFGDWIAIHLIKEKPIIITIRNKDIAQGYKNYFEYLWKQAKK